MLLRWETSPPLSNDLQRKCWAAPMYFRHLSCKFTKAYDEHVVGQFRLQMLLKSLIDIGSPAMALLSSAIEQECRWIRRVVLSRILQCPRVSLSDKLGPEAIW
jgi:hypothetical protein